MNQEEIEKYNQIQLYLTGQLEGKELEVFKQQMQEDPSLQELVFLEQELKYMLSDEPELKHTLSEIRREKSQKTLNTQKPSTAKRVSLINYLKIAASVIGLSVGIWWLVTQFTPSPPYQAFHTHDLPSYTMRGDEEKPKKANEIRKLFDQKQYVTALPKIEQFLDKYPEDQEMRLILGVTNFELEKYNKSLKNFDEIINSRAFAADKAKWYKAGVLLKLKQNDNAKKILQEIIEQKSYKHQEAVKVLKKL